MSLVRPHASDIPKTIHVPSWFQSLCLELSSSKHPHSSFLVKSFSEHHFRPEATSAHCSHKLLILCALQHLRHFTQLIFLSIHCTWYEDIFKFSFRLYVLMCSVGLCVHVCVCV